MTTHTTPIDLRPYHGRECEAVLNSSVIGEFKAKGKISVNNDGEVFLCQNEREGCRADEMFGFSYSWGVQEKNELVWDKNHLKSITLLDEPKSINPEWDWKDGEIVAKGGNNFKCIVLKDNAVCFLDHVTEMSRKIFSFKGAFDNGYRKLPPPPSRKLVEITEEMFDKTNLIGRKVEFMTATTTVAGMSKNVNGRYLHLNDIEFNQPISQCKLIEE